MSGTKTIGLQAQRLITPNAPEVSTNVVMGTSGKMHYVNELHHA